MKKAKKNALLSIVIFVCVLAGAIYGVTFGVGKEKTGKASNITLGLDLQGGVSVTYQIQNENPTDEEIAATIDKLQRRVDAITTDGEVYKEGDSRVTVEIPVDTSKVDPNKILEDLGTPGNLEFIDEANYQKFSSGGEYETILTGKDVKNANASIQQESQNSTKSENVVQLIFTDEGSKKFADATSANIGKVIYIIYDSKVVSSPVVQNAITNGSASITGEETFESAQRLADTIKIGALPLELSEIRSNVVGAKLGQEAISTTLIAAAIGLALVSLLMIILYLFPGFVAVLALGAYVVLMLITFEFMNVSLTLPGLAGIVLSLGMAVDANVIIFTRIKEEMAAGKGVKASVKEGFSKALSAILDGNITTIIAAIVLLVMGTGAIKGFARTLIIGIVLSMISALFITKLLLNSFVTLGVVNPKLFGKAKAPKVRNYIKASKYCVVLSILIIVAGLAFLPINKSKNGKILNYSLEFSGGTSTTVTFDEVYSLDRAEKEVLPVISEATGISASQMQIQTVENGEQVVFKTPELDQQKREKLSQALNEKFQISELSSESISSTISSETKKDAIISVAIASILMLIYIAIRFSDVKFGASAVIALIHDVFIVFTLYSIAQLSVGNTFIACMLTIVGYSINATIIIFDRIRENLKIMDVKKVGMDTIVNTSIAQTLTRTIYTSLTTFITVFVLFIMGVSSIKEFTLTLMAGILGGAYSSVCITGPLWYFLKTKFNKKA